MTTTLAPRPTRTDDPNPNPDPTRARDIDRSVTLSGVLRSEWVKLRSVRSTTTTLVATIGVLLFFGAVAAAVNGGLLTAAVDGDGGPGGADATAIAMTGIIFAPLIIGVLGVMTMTSEYATGTIRSTMTLVPKRIPVLVAKTAILTAVTLPIMIVACLATFLSGQLLLGAGGELPTAALADPGVLRAVLGTAVYLTGVALLGLAAGALLRTTAVAVSALFTLVFLLPGLGGFLLPVSWQENVLLYLPTQAANSFTNVTPGPELLSTGVGAAVFAAWVVVPLLAAAAALKQRPV